MAEAEIKDIDGAMDSDYSGKVREIAAKYKHKQGMLVHVLQDIQRELGYLPEEALRTAARELGFSLAQVYGVASFLYPVLLYPAREKCAPGMCGDGLPYSRGPNRSG